MVTRRDPAVAGTFYCGDGAVLAAQVDAYLREAEPDPRPIRAIVVPHAGYVYSGAVAGRAYGRLREQVDGIRHVVVLGPAHRQPVLGLALPGVDLLHTPLGDVAVDEELAARIRPLPQICTDAVAHQFEHCIEVQLPFIQRLLPHRPVLPLVVGQASAAEVAAVIDAVWADDVLIVISTDLSHFLTEEQARSVDRETITLIESGQGELLDGDNACGFRSICGLMAAGGGTDLVCIDQHTSAEASGDLDRVVGYAAFLAYGG